jgi:hypothetical protein
LKDVELKNKKLDEEKYKFKNMYHTEKSEKE